MTQPWQFGDPLPQRKPEEKQAPAVLDWVLYSEEGKRLNLKNPGLDMPNYLCRQGQYATWDAAQAAKKTYEHYYPSVPFVILHRDDPQFEESDRRTTVTFDPIYPRITPQPAARKEQDPRSVREWETVERDAAGPIESAHRRALRRWWKNTVGGIGERFDRGDTE